MPELSINRGYTDGEALLEADLDNIKNAVTTLVNTTLLDGDNLQNDVITADKIVADSVTTAVLGTGCITTNKVNDLAVTTAKILDGEISTRNIDDSSVTTDKINDLAITYAKFSETARLSSTKIAAKAVFTGTNASPTTINYGDSETTVVSATATSDARKCLIMLQPYDTSNSGVYVYAPYDLITPSTPYAYITLTFKKNGSFLATRTMRVTSSFYQSGAFTDANYGYLSAPLSAFNMLYTAGTISNGDTISVTITQSHSGSGCTGTVSACKLYVIEL